MNIKQGATGFVISRRSNRRHRKHSLGGLLRQLVDSISHRSEGRVLQIMNAASVTLAQVLVLNRLTQQRSAMPSALSRSLNVSPAAVSQMLDRLFQQGLIERLDHHGDRRQRLVAATAKAKALMRELSRARAEEYDRGLRDVSTALRNELTILISRVLAERNASVSATGFHGRSNETERNVAHILEREHAFF